MSCKFAKNIFSMLLCLLLVVTIFPLPVAADMGPKPYINIEFENMGNYPCYGTILSSTENIIMPPNPSYQLRSEPELLETLTAVFKGYSDVDGYYFLGSLWDLNESPSMTWGYMPPSSFKLLLYYPEIDTFVSSGIIEKKEFRAYYTVDMDDIDIGSISFDEDQSISLTELNEITLALERKENWQWEILSFGIRVVCTILIEMAVAWLFGFREKKQLQLLTVANVTTQIILNLLLNSAYYIGYPLHRSFVLFAIAYILYELVVFILEAVCYCIFMNKFSTTARKKRFYVLYALIANAMSFGIGLIIAKFTSNMY